MRWVLLALMAAGCATADAGSFYPSDFYGRNSGVVGTPDPGIGYRLAGRIDFDALDTQDLTAGGDGLKTLSSGVQVRAVDTASGSQDITSGTGLVIASTGTSTRVCMDPVTLGFASSYDDSERWRMVVRATSAANNVGDWYAFILGGTSDGNAAAGNVIAEPGTFWDGATWDMRLQVHDGIGWTTGATFGNLAAAPEWWIVESGPTADARAWWGDAAAEPSDASEFDTLRGWAQTVNAFVSTGTTSVPTPYSSTSQRALCIVAVTADASVTIPSVAMYVR